MNTTPELLTLDQLAKRLPVSKRWLHCEAQAGRIPSLLAGKSRLFNLDAVRAALAKQAAKPREGKP